MRTARLCLVSIAVLLVVGILTGCLKVQPSQLQALFTATPTEHVIPFIASFDGTLSYNPTGEIASYLWTFGDGGSATGALVDHTFSENGVYDVRLTVIDEQGLSTARSMTIHALNPLPEPVMSYSPKSNMDGAYIVSASEWITFNGEASTDDEEVTKYEWYFGDGWCAEGPEVKHRYLYAGTYNVVLTVTDNDGGVEMIVEKIDVLGSSPCYPDVDDDSWNAGGTKCR